MIDDIAKSAIIVKPILFISSSTGFCTFSLLEEKNCTKRETGKGARKPIIPSDEPEQSSDNVLGNSFLPPSRSPRIAVSPGRIKLSHPALCPNTRLSVVMPCFSHHSGLVIGERAHLSGAGRVLCKIGGVPRKKC